MIEEAKNFSLSFKLRVKSFGTETQMYELANRIQKLLEVELQRPVELEKVKMRSDGKDTMQRDIGT